MVLSEAVRLETPEPVPTKVLRVPLVLEYPDCMPMNTFSAPVVLERPALLHSAAFFFCAHGPGIACRAAGRAEIES